MVHRFIKYGKDKLIMNWLVIGVYITVSWLLFVVVGALLPYFGGFVTTDSSTDFCALDVKFNPAINATYFHWDIPLLLCCPNFLYSNLSPL